MPELHPLRWSDVLILTAAYSTSYWKKYDLHYLIAEVDRIEHSILNFDEFSSGLVRLEEHGLIEVQTPPWRVYCSEKGTRLVEPISARNSVAYKMFKEVLQELKVQPWKPGELSPHPENSHRYPGFSLEAYGAEVDKYVGTTRGFVDPK
jgi:hypothetical protein